MIIDSSIIDIVKKKSEPEIIFLDSNKGIVDYKFFIENPLNYFFNINNCLQLGILKSVYSPNYNQYYVYSVNDINSIILLFEFEDYFNEINSIEKLPLLTISYYKNFSLIAVLYFQNTDCELGIAYNNNSKGILPLNQIKNIKIKNSISIYSFINNINFINYSDSILWKKINIKECKRYNFFKTPYVKYNINDTIIIEEQY